MNKNPSKPCAAGRRHAIIRLKKIKECRKGRTAMKRTGLCIALFAVLLLSLTTRAGAYTEKKILIKNSDNQTVRTFSVTVDRPEADSSTDIQKALDYARNFAREASPMTVILPKGTYNIFGTLNLYSNTTLDLSGSVLTRNENSGSIIRFGRGGDSHAGYSGYRNITVKNGTLDGGKKGNASLMRFAHAGNIQILSVKFRNTKNVQHLLTFAAAENVLIDGCSFSDMTFTCVSSSNSEAVQIDILNPHHFTDNVYDGTRTKNVTVSGCSFKNVDRGVGTHSAIVGYYFDNINITDNIFSGISGYAVNALNYRGSNICRNRIYQCGSGISCSHIPNTAFDNMYAPLSSQDKVDLNADVLISDNRITLTDTDYMHTVYGISIVGAVAKNIKDRDNKVFSADLRISGVTVKNNNIISSVRKKNTCLIDITGAVGSSPDENSNLKITGNKIAFTDQSVSKYRKYGLRLVECRNLRLYKNACFSYQYAGNFYDSALIADRCRNVTVRSNAFSYTLSFGMKLSGCSSLTVQENSLKSCKNNAIYVVSDSSKINLLSNRIYDCSAYSVSVRDSHAGYISQNRVSGGASHAIYLTGSGRCSAITDNTIRLPGGHGIYLNGNAYVKQINGNIIKLSSPGCHAIGVNGSANVKTINGNTINVKSKNDTVTLTSLNGIYINSPQANTNEISGNNISSCVQNGICVVGVKSSPLISSNTVRSCKNGISYTSGRLSGNNIAKCTGTKTVKR